MTSLTCCLSCWTCCCDSSVLSCRSRCTCSFSLVTRSFSGLVTAPSLWSVAGSIPVTIPSIKQSLTHVLYKPVLMFLSIVDSVVAPSPWPAVTAVPPDREWSQYHGLGDAATAAWWYSLVTNLLLLSGHSLLLSGHSLLLSGHSLSLHTSLLSGHLLDITTHFLLYNYHHTVCCW